MTFHLQIIKILSQDHLFTNTTASAYKRLATYEAYVNKPNPNHSKA